MSVDSEFEKITQIVYTIDYTLNKPVEAKYIKNKIKRKCKGMFNIDLKNIDVYFEDTTLIVMIDYHDKTFSFRRNF